MNRDELYLGIVAITALFALAVVVFVVYSAIKYRDTGREIGWALIPFFIASGIFVWASIAFIKLVSAAQNTSPK